MTVILCELMTKVPTIRATAEPDRLLPSSIDGIKHLPCELDQGTNRVPGAQRDMWMARITRPLTGSAGTRRFVMATCTWPRSSTTTSEVAPPIPSPV
jgi:hypothetical protein